MMDIRPHASGPEVPEADAIEQRTPALPESREELLAGGQVPVEAPHMDFIEQHTAVLPGNAGYERIDPGTAGAAEADLMEQAAAPATDDDDEYPNALEEAD